MQEGYLIAVGITIELILFPRLPSISTTMPHTPSQPDPATFTLVMAIVIVMLVWLS